MNPALTPAGYPFSRDYGRLIALARHASVVCFVDYHVGGAGVVRDVARTAFSAGDGREVFEINARGTGYVQTSTEKSFIERCEALNLEFVVPPAPITGDFAQLVRGWRDQLLWAGRPAAGSGGAGRIERVLDDMNQRIVAGEDIEPEPARSGVMAAAQALIEADRAMALTDDHVAALENAIAIQKGTIKLPASARSVPAEAPESGGGDGPDARAAQ